MEEYTIRVEMMTGILLKIQTGENVCVCVFVIIVELNRRYMKCCDGLGKLC